MIYYHIILIVTLFIPLPSIQHFIWPLNMCVLADICNHTWIPECAKESNEETLRLFIDECDLYEYNCDYGMNYEIVNYSDCFAYSSCPTSVPCPSHPTCPNHLRHKMGQHYVFLEQGRRIGRPPSTIPSLPMHMLKGKRRYTPTPKWKRRRTTILKRTTKTTTKVQSSKKRFSKKTKLSLMTPRKTIILKKGSLLKNGKVMIRVVKGFVTVPMKSGSSDSDFLE